MITDNILSQQSDEESLHPPQARPIKIVKETSDQMYVFDGKGTMCFRTFSISGPQQIQFIRHRASIVHQNVIRLYKIEVPDPQFSKELIEPQRGPIRVFPIRCGLLFENFNQTLTAILKQYSFQFEQQEVIDTFEPIIEGLEHMIKCQYYPHRISTDSIVWTSDNTIKFMDEYLMNPSLPEISTKSSDQIIQELYEQLLSIIFEIFFSFQKAKNWKTKMKLAQDKLSKKSFEFLNNLYKKCDLRSSLKAEKTKKIQKITDQDLKNKKHKKRRCQHSKENLLVQ